MEENKSSNENDISIKKDVTKISFEEYINNKISTSNENNEIKKDELLKEVEEKVENENEIKEKINSLFENNSTIQLKDLKEKIKTENIEKKKELIDIISPQKKISPDLEFLSQDLPEDKNRVKILSSCSLTSELIENKNLEKNMNDIILDISKIESVIKPVNEFEENKKENNEEEKNKKERPKEINRPVYNPNYNSEHFTFKNLSDNKKFFDDEFNNSKILFKHSNNQNVVNNNDDYFFSIYKTYANKNKIIKTIKNLNDKVNKVASKPISINGIYGNFKGNNDFNKYQVKTNINIYKTERKNNSFLEKIEKEKNSINNSENKNVNLFEFKKKNYDLTNINEKNAYIKNFKNDLKKLSLNMNKQKSQRDKNLGFDEINKKLDDLYKKNKGENQTETNEDKNQNNVKEEIKKEEIKKEEIKKEEIKNEEIKEN